MSMTVRIVHGSAAELHSDAVTGHEERSRAPSARRTQPIFRVISRELDFHVPQWQECPLHSLVFHDPGNGGFTAKGAYER